MISAASDRFCTEIYGVSCTNTVVPSWRVGPRREGDR